MYDIEPLRSAILRQAVQDYKSALMRRNYHKMAELERFFLGWWGQLLSDGHGEYIIDHCKELAKSKRKIRNIIDK